MLLPRLFARPFVAALAALALFTAAVAAVVVPASADPVVGPAIKVNNVAYAPGLPKHATVVADTTSPVTWTLTSSGTPVLSGQTTVFGDDAMSGDHVHIIDFSAHDEPGQSYRLEVGDSQSYPFAIAAEPYAQLRDDALSFFYHQRSGTPIEEQFVGADHARPAGHVNVSPNTGDDDVPCRPATPCDYTLDVRGGWYDAGDHGKYVVNGGISTWQLLNAYERAVFSGDTASLADGTMAIPEAGNGVPDILDEARWNIEFLMSMQVPPGSPMAGMAHHKIHDENWTSLPTAPHLDEQPRYLAPPSTAATLNLAAVTAQCARIWTDIDSGFAADCLQTSESAYAAAQQNPDVIASPDDDAGGGAYSDSNLADEFYWAAAELFATTGGGSYQTDLTAHELYFGQSFGLRGTDWGNTGMLGDITLALVPTSMPDVDVQALRSSFAAHADTLLGVMNDQGYPTPYWEERSGGLWYDWGSNNLVLNQAVVLALAYDFTESPEYRNGVFATLDYILGRNPLNQSYVTGHGEQATTNPHHRFWANQLDPSYPAAPPGVLAGGPNTGLQDPLAAEELSGCAPQKCYLDHIDSWSTNEVTINWNSALSWVTVWAADQLPSTTPPDDTEPPSQPGTPTASDVTSSEATLTWSAATDNVGVAEYQVYVNDELTTTTPQTATTLTGLSPSTDYSAYVVARDAAGNISGPSVPVEFTTLDDTPGDEACTVAFDANPWNSGPGQGGFTAYLTIHNTGTDPIDGWALTFDLPSGHGFDQGWSATWTTSGQSVTATNLTWNQTIGPDESVDVGFNGTWSSSFSAPSAFAVNGESCATE